MAAIISKSAVIQGMVSKALPTFRTERSLPMRCASLAVAASLALVGCRSADTDAFLHPEGPPEVKQVFALDNDGTSKLIFGTHPDINADDPNSPHGYQAGPVMNGLTAGNRIRIIFDELLMGGSVEQFACACF